MSNKPFLITDGYTEEAFIKEVPNGIAAIRFEFRPALIEVRAEILERVNKCKDSRQAEQYQAKELADRIVHWNITEIDGDDKEVIAPISAKTILSFRSSFAFQRMVAIVLYGSEWGDTDPDRTPETQNEMDDLELESALTDRPVSDVRQRQNEKN